MENLKQLQGVIKDNIHYYPFHIFYSYTDAEQIVYFANYFKIVEEARSSLLNMLAEKYKQDKQNINGDFVVRETSAKYLKSARLNDDLIVKSKFTEITKVAVKMEQDVYKDDQLLVSTTCKFVFVYFTENKPYSVAKMPSLWYDVINSMVVK